ncbi:MAG: hypothetical protein AAFV25_23255 [Bacteroidota bacterium]
MQVQKLTECIQAYAKSMARKHYFEELYPWESQYHFQQYWDVEAVDFGKMYDKALHNGTTRRLWKRENYQPKAQMLRLIAHQPEFVRRMFRNLLDESKEIGNRIARFKFCCDDVLSDYKADHPTSIENNHYHEDNHMIFLYLAFHRPDQYTFYHFTEFRDTLQKLGTRNLPGPHDLERFAKVSRTIFTFLAKEEIIFEKLRDLLPADWKHLNQSMLLVQDFYRFVSAGR